MHIAQVTMKNIGARTAKAISISCTDGDCHVSARKVAHPRLSVTWIIRRMTVGYMNLNIMDFIAGHPESVIIRLKRIFTIAVRPRLFRNVTPDIIKIIPYPKVQVSPIHVSRAAPVPIQRRPIQCPIPADRIRHTPMPHHARYVKPALTTTKAPAHHAPRALTSRKMHTMSVRVPIPPTARGNAMRGIMVPVQTVTHRASPVAAGTIARADQIAHLVLMWSRQARQARTQLILCQMALGMIWNIVQPPMIADVIGYWKMKQENII